MELDCTENAMQKKWLQACNVITFVASVHFFRWHASLEKRTGPPVYFLHGLYVVVVIVCGSCHLSVLMGVNKVTHTCYLSGSKSCYLMS